MQKLPIHMNDTMFYIESQSKHEHSQAQNVLKSVPKSEHKWIAKSHLRAIGGTIQDNFNGNST